jgi:hypothetical protein
LELQPPTRQSVVVESNKLRMTTPCYRVHGKCYSLDSVYELVIGLCQKLAEHI